MSTDDDKHKLEKLLKGLEVPDTKLTERCLNLIKCFHKKYDSELEDEEKLVVEDLSSENPFVAPKDLLAENESKLKKLLMQHKRAPKKPPTEIRKVTTEIDPKRPWRTNSMKEKLLRINNVLKSHQDKGALCVAALDVAAMAELITKCKEEGQAAPLVSANKLKDVIDCAKKNLPNFEYKNVNNSTATTILLDIHDYSDESVAPNSESLLPAVTTI